MYKDLEQSWHVGGTHFSIVIIICASKESDDEQAEKCPDGILRDIEKCPEGCLKCANRERVGEGDVPMTRAGKPGPRPFDLVWAPQEQGSTRHQGHGGDTQTRPRPAAAHSVLLWPGL